MSNYNKYTVGTVLKQTSSTTRSIVSTYFKKKKELSLDNPMLF